ncbi:MAG: 2Fe-2S iron-sulfur cluster-binding protein [Nitrospiria bacterium]
MATHRVTFLPANLTVEVEDGTSVLDAALNHAVDLEHNCGGNCACSTCHVIVQQGMESLTGRSEEEEDQLEDADGLTKDSRLACQAKISGPVIVVIPSS